MNRFLTNVLLMLGLVMVLMSFAAAAPVGGVTNILASEKGTGSASGTATLEGGNVTLVNVSGTQITSKWGGFYGFISGGIQLSDSAANKFYTWTISNFTGAVVYAANNTVNSWTLSPISGGTAPYGVTTPATNDDYSHTFTTTESFHSNSMDVANTPYVTTYENGAMGTLKTYGLVLAADPTVNIWAGLVAQNVDSFKSGQKVDYQILAPAKSTGTVYHFYLEMP